MAENTDHIAEFPTHADPDSSAACTSFSIITGYRYRAGIVVAESLPPL
jgi:hypothetical protein